VPKGGSLSHKELGPLFIGKNMRKFPKKSLGLAPSVAERWDKTHGKNKFESFPLGLPTGGSLNHVERGPALVGENTREFSPGSALGRLPQSHGM
jgi:hypothetical protein